MRKIYITLLFVAIVIVVNFMLWFAHTRTINAALVGIKKELGVMGIKVTYDDLYYDNFKSWNVEGVISNLKISSERLLAGSVVINRVGFSSQPFKEHVELRGEDNVFLTLKTLGGEENYKLVFANGVPSIEIEFNTSLKALNDSFSDSSSKLFGQIKKIEYYDSGVTLFDLDSQQNYISIGSSKFSLKADQNVDKEKYELLINYKDLKYNPEFKGVKDTQVISEGNIKRGAQNANIDLIINCLISDKQKEYRKEHDLKGAGIFDMYDVNISDMSFSNELFGLSMVGGAKKYLGIMLPTVDVKITVSNYNNMIDQYIAMLNSIIKERPEIAAFLPYRLMEDAQIKRVKELFSRFKKNDTDLELTLSGSKDKEFMISEVPALLFMTELQNILGSSVENKSARTGLENRLEERRAKVAK